MGHEMDASFSTLVTGIATQAIIAMGLAKSEDNTSEQVNLPLAKFNIDLLLMLQDKTESNLDEHEKQLLLYIVQDLQSKYILIKEVKK
jgi:tRNA A37 threonylcarbamoyltransferase TsaD